MSAPDAELLRAEFLGITVRHDEHDTPRDQLAATFAAISERYDLTRMEYTDGGATLSGGAGSELVLRPGHTAAAGVTSLGFHEGLERVAGMLREGLARLEPGPLLAVEDITLVAVWDLEHEDAARDYLTREVLGLDPERQALLASDDDDASHGLRLWRSLGDGMLDVAVEPMHSDTSKLYLRLVYTDDNPIDEVDDVIERAEAVNQYLHGRLVAFICAGAPR